MTWILIRLLCLSQWKGPPGIEGLDGKDGKPGLRVSYTLAKTHWGHAIVGLVKYIHVTFDAGFSFVRERQAPQAQQDREQSQ